MRKRLSLEELELQLPKIELKETRFLLGGTDYSSDTDPEDPDNDPVDDGNHGEDGSDPNDGGPDDNGGDDDPYNGGVDGDDPDGGDNGGGDGEYNDEEDPDYGDGEQGNEGDYNDDEDPNNDDSNGNNGSGSGSNGGNAPDAPDFPDGFSDGMDPSEINFENFSDDINPEFNENFVSILQSNSIIANLVDQITANGVNLTFGTQDLSNYETTPGEDILAATYLSNNNIAQGNVNVVFDVNNIGEDGNWNNYYETINQQLDGIEYETSSEALVHSIIHELHHALLISEVHAAVVSGLTQFSTPVEVYNHVVSEVGQELADIFYDTSIPELPQLTAPDAEAWDQYSHEDLFNETNFLNDVEMALFEYLQDVQAYQEYLNDLDSWQEQMDEYNDQQESGSPNGDGQG